MPLVPNFIENTLFLTLNAGPGPILDVWSGPAFWSVHAALKLGLLDALADGPKTGEQVAQAVGADAKGVRILLGVLESLGYVSTHNGLYDNTRMTKKWLLDSGSINLKPYFLYWGALMEHIMPRLSESIRDGYDMDLYGWLETQAEVSRNFQESMIQLARFVAGDVAKALKIPAGATRLLDVGGGHGEFSVALCRATPGLSAVIFDGEQALVTGQRTVEAAGMSDRIAVHVGDFLCDDLPQGFDVALLFNVVHGLAPAQSIDLMKKVHKALKPGGQVVILEQSHGVAPLPLTGAATHLLSLVYNHTVGGQVYTCEEIRAWLSAAGFGDFSQRPVMKASSVLITAKT